MIQAIADFFESWAEWFLGLVAEFTVAAVQFMVSWLPDVSQFTTDLFTDVSAWFSGDFSGGQAVTTPLDWAKMAVYVVLWFVPITSMVTMWLAYMAVASAIRTARLGI